MSTFSDTQLPTPGPVHIAETAQTAEQIRREKKRKRNAADYQAHKHERLTAQREHYHSVKYRCVFCHSVVPQKYMDKHAKTARHQRLTRTCARYVPWAVLVGSDLDRLGEVERLRTTEALVVLGAVVEEDE